MISPGHDTQANDGGPRADVTAWVRASASTPLSCLREVSGVTWLRWDEGREMLDLWCQSVGPPVLAGAPVTDAEISRLVVVSWNVHVGGGRVEELIAGILGRSSDRSTGLVVLMQETFRGGADVPEQSPRSLSAPCAIRPRRPALDVAGIANAFRLSVASAGDRRWRFQCPPCSRRSNRGGAGSCGGARAVRHRSNEPLAASPHVLLFFLVGRHDFMFSTLGSDVPRSCQTLPDPHDSDHLPLLLEIEMR